MTGKQRVERVLRGEAVDRSPVLPIIHTAVARCAGVPLGRYFTDADTMAETITGGCRRFGFDGVQLTMGVTAEAEALGAGVEQPDDGAPLLKQHPLPEEASVDTLRGRDVNAAGRMPMYQSAVRKVVDAIGDSAFVISTLRGPLNIASQLRGVETVLIDMIRRPDETARLLEFTTNVAVQVSQASLASGAHALVFGEATCSPNFISPKMYRQLVHPWHVRLVGSLREMGWRTVGLHVCGNIIPILDDLISTGADILDVDYQVPAAKALAAANGRVTLRGNLKPTDLLFRGSPEQVRNTTAALCREVAGRRWIVSSGCDIPPGTPAANIAALAEGAAAAGSG